MRQNLKEKKQKQKFMFDIHGSVHRKFLSRNTNKMQISNTLCGDRPLPRLSGKNFSDPALTTARHHIAI
jgi:hypothetical protein